MYVQDHTTSLFALPTTRDRQRSWTSMRRHKRITPNLPTTIVPTNIAKLKLSGKSPMDMRIPPLKFKIMLESNPLKSTMLVGGLGVNQYLTRLRYHGQRFIRGDLDSPFLPRLD